MGTIREDLKEKFNNWLDQRCDKGEATYNHALDDCPDDKFDWRDMLIEELLDGLQYQEKEIKKLKKENEIILFKLKHAEKHIPASKVIVTKSPFEIEDSRAYVSSGKSTLVASWKPPYADLDD